MGKPIQLTGAKEEDYSSTEVPEMDDEQDTPPKETTDEGEPETEEYDLEGFDDDEYEDEDGKEETTPEPEDIEIVYNKKPVKIPKDQVKNYLQKGYNYDKQTEKLNESNTRIQELENISGMSFDRIIESVRNQKLEQDVQKRVDDTGEDEETARRHIVAENQRKADEARAQKTILTAQRIKEKDTYRDRPHFAELETDIDKMISQNPAIDVNTAYNYLLGANFDKFSKAQTSKTQKRTIADVQDRMKRGAEVKPSKGTTEVEVTPSLRKLARDMGVPIKEVVKHMKK